MKTIIALIFVLAVAFADSYIDNDGRAVVLDYHNQLRNRVAGGGDGQPQSSNMQRMQWDQQLAAQSQQWANQKVWAHSYGNYGENLAMVYSSQPIDINQFYLEYLVKAWYDELYDFDTNEVSQFMNGQGYQTTGVIGHYTQLVWAKSNRLGCGATSYYEGGWYKVYLVCQYLAIGNYLYQPIYKIGSPASQCPNGQSRDSQYTNMCSTGSQNYVYQNYVQLETPSQEYIDGFKALLKQSQEQSSGQGVSVKKDEEVQVKKGAPALKRKTSTNNSRRPVQQFKRKSQRFGKF